MISSNGNGPLRLALEAARDGTKAWMANATVLSAKNDPYRIDTPANHQAGRWLAEQVDRLELDETKTIHMRGLHYKLSMTGVTKPGGAKYQNTDADWTWLQETPADAARWLGYLPFEQFHDARNDPPEITRFSQPEPEASLAVELEVTIPDTVEPTIKLAGFVGVQPYKLVIFGEKSSLGEVVRPIAESRRADLYLPKGELSDTLIYEMAKTGAEDGRPMVVFTLTDCDYAGWQMAISIARKLQAFKTMFFPALRFQVRPVALTPDQVREYGLPSEPYKEAKNAAVATRQTGWLAATGVEQTEIDAALALQPNLIPQLLRQAIKPFWDSTLETRVKAAKDAWFAEAWKQVNGQLDEEQLNALKVEAQEKLAELQDEIEELNDALSLEVPEDVEFPPIVIPEAVVNVDRLPSPLIDSEWDWTEQTVRLKAAKAYSDA
ncbi:MAG: hypothetical protein WKF41_06845 [Gaiellaceae bacterium]